MNETTYLFDMTPYTPRPRRSGYRTLPPRVRASLGRLKRTLDAIPKDEYEKRRQRAIEQERAVVHVRGRA